MTNAPTICAHATVAALLQRDPPSNSEEELLSTRARAGDEDARWELVLANARYAFVLASQYADCGLPMDDLFAEGLKGMYHVAGKFDSRFGRFITYAQANARQTIAKFVATYRLEYHVPSHTEGLRKRVRRELGEEAIANLSASELAQKFKITLKAGHAIKDLFAKREYLDAPQGMEAGSSAVAERITDSSAVNPAFVLENDENNGELASLLGAIPRRSRMVLEHRFGLNGRKRLTLEQISKRMKITRERVRQIEFVSLRKLRAEAGRRRARAELEFAEARVKFYDAAA